MAAVEGGGFEAFVYTSSGALSTVAGGNTKRNRYRRKIGVL